MSSEPSSVGNTFVRSIKTFAIAVTLSATAHTALANDLRVGKAAPSATLVTLDGQHISTDSLRGHTVILAFWATWCEPCREELPLLSSYAKTHRDQGLKVLAFSLDDTDNIKQLRAISKTLDFPVGLLNHSKAQGYGRMWRIPVSFVIDRNGVLRYNGWKAHHPAWTEASLKQVVEPLLRDTTHSGAK